MNLKIKPSPLRGTLAVPSSKSLSHRALICASLAQGTSHLTNLLQADDLTATANILRDLGSHILSDSGTNQMIVRGIEAAPSIGKTLECNESGSTLRFLLPLALNGQKNILTGKGRLVERPLEIYRTILRNQNIHCHSLGAQELPVEIQGFLKPDHFVFPGNISSQFISGLLFALPRLNGESTITLTDSLESKDYIDLTLSMLTEFQIQIDVSPDFLHYRIPGNQTYQAQNITVEGDYSQAAFWIVAGALQGGIALRGLNPHSLQGDRAILNILERMNGKYSWSDNELIIHPATLNGTVIDASHCPDLVPILAVLATQISGETQIINAKRLRIKESDRLASMTSELSKIGAKIQETEDSLVIQGKTSLSGGIVHSHKDHRIAMAMGIASIFCSEELWIKEADVVSKSYPGFWQDFIQIGGVLDEC